LKRLNVYVDTSVLGGSWDREFDKVSQKFIAEVREGKYEAIISDLTLAEIESVPQHIRKKLLALVKDDFTIIEESEESRMLAGRYIDEKVIGAKFENDARHISIAVVNGIDILVSWNFRHIVNVAKIKGFNGINIKEGYSPIDIRSPLEVIEYED
jgi:hypothetical protein